VSTTRDLQWRFDAPGTRSSKEKQGWPPKAPSARPSVAPQRRAGAPPSRGNAGNAWLHPLHHTSPPAHSSPLLTEDTSELIKTEVARLLEPYKQLPEAANSKAVLQDKVIAGKDEEIAGLREELAAAKAQAKLPAVPAAASSPPDPKFQLEQQDLRRLRQDVSGLSTDFKAVVNRCDGMKETLFHMSNEVTRHTQDMEERMEDQEQLLESEKEVRQIQWANMHQATQQPPKKGKKVSTGVTAASFQAFNFGGATNQQLLLAQPQWPACPGTFVVRQADTAAVASEPLRVTASERPPELETGEEGEEVEEEAEVEKEPEGVLQVTPQLASGDTIPTKIPPAVVNVRACSKSPPAKTKRAKSPGDTPGRDEVLRQNAADRMSGVDADVARWAVAAAEPRKELLF
jgi:hypothetical protein